MNTVVKVGGQTFDSMKEACDKLDISRNTLLSYIADGTVSEPPTVKRGKTKYRYFPKEWYDDNLHKVTSAA
jgi:predicted site-specific integrase-resolvase